MDLSNREIATVLWVAIGLAFIGYKMKGDIKLMAFAEALFNRIILTYVTCLLVYTVFAIIVLAKFDLWDFSQVKTTLVWFIFVALISAFRVHQKKPNFVRKLIFDNLKILVVLDFLLKFYTFDFWIELILVPILTFLACVSAFATEPHHKSVKNLIDGVLALIGLCLVIRSVSMAAADLANLTKPETVRDFYTEPLLSLTLLPFLIITFIYYSYERIFTRLKLFIPDTELRYFARQRACQAFGPNIHLLDQWFKLIALDQPKSREEIDALISETWNSASREKHPRVVSLNEGWCPYKASRFLADHGLRPDQYRRLDQGTYFCSSSKKIDLEFPAFADLSYSVEGSISAATMLDLEIFVNGAEAQANADASFLTVAADLFSRATNVKISVEAIAVLCSQNPFEETTEFIVIEHRLRSWDQLGGSYERKLRLRHVQHRGSLPALVDAITPVKNDVRGES